MNVNNLKFNRRAFLRAAGLSLGSASFVGGCAQPAEPILTNSDTVPPGIIGADGRRVLPWSNWSGNLSCQPSLRKAPRSISEVQEFVRRADQTIRCVGAGHSFSPLVPTNESLLSLARIRGVSSIDKKSQQATIRAGTLLSQIGAPLWQEGLSLINMPDIDTQALAGAIATSTHGTGASLGSLSAYVTRLQLVDARGDLISCSAEINSDLFNAARNSLGALGVVTEVSLQTTERYHLRERSWVMRADDALEQAEQLRDRHRHFELFPMPHADYMIAFTIDKVADAGDLETSEILTKETQDNADAEETFLSLVNLTEKLPWIKSFIMNSGLRSVEEEIRAGRNYEVFGNLRNIRFNEMEYTVPSELGVACLREILTTIKRENIDVVFPMEMRYVKADDVWLSPFYQRDGCSISCQNFHDQDYKNYFALIEPIFWKYQGRPHWGKIHSLGPADFALMYPRWSDFKQVRGDMDPANRFSNAHTKTLFAV